jgi:hypothetical protein
MAGSMSASASVGARKGRGAKSSGRNAAAVAAVGEQPCRPQDVVKKKEKGWPWGHCPNQ